ncbi:MAG: hypothetical protein AAF800_13015 [Planctomycetota bacterium]
MSLDDAELVAGAALLGEVVEVGGLPRPDWAGVQRRWRALPEAQQGPAWGAIERAWMEALAAGWNAREGRAGLDAFRVWREGETLLTTDLPADEAGRVLAFSGRALRTIERCLTGLGLAEISDGGPGYDVVVVCRRVEDYLDYVSVFDAEEHRGGVSGGVCLAAGAVHVVTHGAGAGDLHEVLAHELAHSRLVSLELPAWLEEGLVTHLEEAVAPSGAYAADLQTVALHRGYWTPARLAAFFEGSAFCGEDDAHGLAYHLAYHAVGGLMAEDAQRFARLLRSASPADAGAAAVEALFDKSLTDVLPRFVREAAEGAVEDRSGGDDAAV